LVVVFGVLIIGFLVVFVDVIIIGIVIVAVIAISFAVALVFAAAAVAKGTGLGPCPAYPKTECHRPLKLDQGAVLAIYTPNGIILYIKWYNR